MANAEGRAPTPRGREEFTVVLPEETARKLRLITQGKQRVYKLTQTPEDLMSLSVQRWVDEEYEIMYRWNELPSGERL
jgi:hypothetical protein